MRHRFGAGAVKLGWIGLLAVTIAACDAGGSEGSGTPCGGGTCGVLDHQFYSTYYCAMAGGGIGLSWRLLDDCLRQCNSAGAWGCDVTGCSAGCATDHGSGTWMSCTSVPTGGEVRSSGCFLQGSGLYGETVPCDCR